VPPPTLVASPFPVQGSDLVDLGPVELDLYALGPEMEGESGSGRVGGLERVLAGVALHPGVEGERAEDVLGLRGRGFGDEESLQFVKVI